MQKKKPRPRSDLHGGVKGWGGLTVLQVLYVLLGNELVCIDLKDGQLQAVLVLPAGPSLAPGAGRRRCFSPGHTRQR